MKKELPVSIISNSDLHLLYFDVDEIDNPDSIQSAYIVVDRDHQFDKDGEISVSINDRLSEADFMSLRQQKKASRGFSYGSEVLTDASDAVKMIATGYVENNGIVLRTPNNLCNPRLMICYHQKKIYPNCEGDFFEKELRLSSCSRRIESPWFFSGLSKTITFFVENIGCSEFTIHLENSPNAIQHVDDAQRITVHPGETVDIVPYKFSKFIRLIAHSDNRNVALRLWFQTQLLP